MTGPVWPGSLLSTLSGPEKGETVHPRFLHATRATLLLASPLLALRPTTGFVPRGRRLRFRLRKSSSAWMLALVLVGIGLFPPAGQAQTVLVGDGFATGYNAYGQLGDGSTTDHTLPVLVPDLAGVAAIAGGAYHNLALKSDGTVLAWGYNAHGQLGDGSTTNHNSPAPVPGLIGVVAIEAGLAHSLALKSNGTVVAWGANFYGGLGDGSTTSRSSPVEVSGLTDAIAVSAGSLHSLALKSDGTVLAWGYNAHGQLGDGSTTSSSSPVVVSGLTDVTAIAAGENHSLALSRDGTVLAWGNNHYGQLGDGGTIPSSSSPVVVSGLTDVIAVSAGADHSLALRSDGTVVAWGRNDFGQLGDGGTIRRSFPAPVRRLFAVTAIAAGGHHSLFVGAFNPNHPPVAYDQSLTTNPSQVRIKLLANDADGDRLTYTVVDGPSHGTLTGVAPDLTYTPSPGYYGPDSFTFQATDGQANSNRATTSITVNPVKPVNDAPRASDDTAATNMNTSVEIAPLDNDTDTNGDPLTIIAVTAPANGTATINQGTPTGPGTPPNPDTLTYTPKNGFAGTDSFTYTIADPGGLTATATVTVTVSKPNRPPVAVADVAFTEGNTLVMIPVLSNDRDPDGDMLTLTGASPGASGATVIVNRIDGTLTYKAPSGFRGRDTLTYGIEDGRGGTAIGRVNVIVR